MLRDGTVTKLMTMLQKAMIFFVLLLPSAFFAWCYRDMPWFGHLHDDSLIFVTAQSLASGDGYKIASLPETPSQTKYPPLYSLYVSLAWHWNPNFPQNLAQAALLNWLALAAALCLSWNFFRQCGITDSACAGATAVLAVSPYLLLFEIGRAHV